MDKTSLLNFLIVCELYIIDDYLSLVFAYKLEWSILMLFFSKLTGTITLYLSFSASRLFFVVKVTVDLQGTIFCDFSLSRQSKHYQFNYIFQKKLFKNLEMHASYPRKRVFK